MSRCAAWLAILLAVGTVRAEMDTIPAWLDTLPPVVEALPAGRHHARPFSVSLRSNETGIIWVGVGSPTDMQPYRIPVTVAKAGATIVFFYGEDAVGNKSPIDSVTYILDLTPPKLRISPEPGRFSSPVVVRVRADEPCRYFSHVRLSGGDRHEIVDTMLVSRQFRGYISAIDSAGNRTTSRELAYVVDTSSLQVWVTPPEGVYSGGVRLAFKTDPPSDVYYSVDPLAPPKRFSRYSEPVGMPCGLTLVRYFARDRYGRESAIMRASFVVDTVAPVLRYRHVEGTSHDTLHFWTKEKTTVRYSTDEDAALDSGNVYRNPVLVRRRGRGYIKAVARDRAGNLSELVVWEKKYDKIPPVLRPSLKSGVYTEPVTLTFTSSEPVRIFYTLNDSEPGKYSYLYTTGVHISKGGKTIVRYIGVDEAGNVSEEGRLEFDLDVTPPVVRSRVLPRADKSTFAVTITANEPAEIYYEIGDKEPTVSSACYRDPVRMKAGETLRFFAIDKAGNRSSVRIMDELQRPMISASPGGGIYNDRVEITLTCNIRAGIYWRILPDTTFVPYRDSVVLRSEGLHSLEFFGRTAGGFRSTVERREYLVDWTPPHARITVKKGKHDSATVFFESNENATIYYTLDGTSPLNSPSVRIAANKFFMSKDRIRIDRSKGGALAFYAEDVAGNISGVSILDIFRPRVVPSIPAGPDRVYSRVLSISLSAYNEQSQIYYEHHGLRPTQESPLFSKPITLLQSDTIAAFVVDASGFRGDVEKFVFLVDLPPSPKFVHSPDTAMVDRVVSFDASETIDHETSTAGLTFLWDFDGDGHFDREQLGNPGVDYMYIRPGRYSVSLEVVDRMKRTTRVTREVLVRGICPEHMVSVPRDSAGAFCIDKYEWPNRRGAEPLTDVPWIRAKMLCIDQGKRLCTAEEWQYVCAGGSGRNYPYGSRYGPGLCPVEGDAVYEAGSFGKCGEGFGARDMVGNVWEWVVDKAGAYPVMVGGSYRHGNKAHCRLRAKGSLTEGMDTVGFRCCR